MKVLHLALCGVLVASVTPAVAGHIQPGLWNLSQTVRYIGADKMRPFLTGRLAAKGIVIPTRPQTTQADRCVSPQDALIDRLPRLDQPTGACDEMSFEPTSDGYEGRAICQSYLWGHVLYNVKFQGDTHYEGESVFQGHLFGTEMEIRTNFSGDRTSADCDAPAAH